MTETTSLYKDFHKIDLSHLKNLLRENKMDAQVARTLVSYWKQRLDDKSDALYSRYIEYYLFFESLKALFIAAFIFDMKTGKTRHSYGIFPALAPAVHSAIAAGVKDANGIVDFEYESEKYSLHYVRSGYHEEEYAIAALALKDSVIEENLTRLKYVFERFYMPSSFSRDNRIGILFPETENLITTMVNPTLAQKQPVTFTYMYFESLTKYVGLAGENFARELLTELENDVHKILKDTDRSILLSTREILIVSLNCESDILKKRFGSSYFHAKSLLLSFNAHYHTIYTPVVELHTLWNDITGNIGYQRKAAAVAQG